MVGLFWVLDQQGAAIVLALAVPLDQAIAYGDMLTVDIGHLDYWTELAQRGGAALRAVDLPTAPCWSDYDEWPRGRVMYDTLARRFVIRADRQLHTANLLDLIAGQFGINWRDAQVRPDEHYQSVRRPTWHR